MKKCFYSILICFFFIVGLVSCTDKKVSEMRWIKDRIRVVSDSIGSSKIIACFSELSGLSVLERDTAGNKSTIKITYRKGFPVYVDSLVYIKKDSFKSKHFNTTYLIKDTIVISINYVKIIHPSSNWQGQTPWSQPYVNYYKRLDVKGNP